jgi:hypothetical protein
MGAPCATSITDPKRDSDTAIIKIEKVLMTIEFHPTGLPAVQLGFSDELPPLLILSY